MLFISLMIPRQNFQKVRSTSVWKASNFEHDCYLCQGQNERVRCGFPNRQGPFHFDPFTGFIEFSEQCWLRNFEPSLTCIRALEPCQSSTTVDSL